MIAWCLCFVIVNFDISPIFSFRDLSWDIWSPIDALKVVVLSVGVWFSYEAVTSTSLVGVADNDGTTQSSKDLLCLVGIVYMNLCEHWEILIQLFRGLWWIPRRRRYVLLNTKFASGGWF
jgi:hypothetical protein